jgi:heme exporter protein C
MKFLTPKNVERFAAASIKPAFVIAALALIAGLYLALIKSPADYQQGTMVRVMYIHVPSAWLAMMCYGLIAIMSFGYIVWRNPVCYIIAREIAPIGAIFTAICLITGSIWGYPTWGTWWVWDARLTSVLILFFLYLGFMAMSGSFHSDEKEAKSASILALVGAVNLPIIKYSVDWWNTLHQPASVFRLQGSAIHAEMLKPLLVMSLAWLAIFIAALSIRVITALLQNQLDRLLAD